MTEQPRKLVLSGQELEETREFERGYGLGEVLKDIGKTYLEWRFPPTEGMDVEEIVEKSMDFSSGLKLVPLLKLISRQRLMSILTGKEGWEYVEEGFKPFMRGFKAEWERIVETVPQNLWDELDDLFVKEQPFSGSLGSYKGWAPTNIDLNVVALEAQIGRADPTSHFFVPRTFAHEAGHHLEREISKIVGFPWEKYAKGKEISREDRLRLSKLAKRIIPAGAFREGLEGKPTALVGARGTKTIGRFEDPRVPTERFAAAMEEYFYPTGHRGPRPGFEYHPEGERYFYQDEFIDTVKEMMEIVGEKPTRNIFTFRREFQDKFPTTWFQMKKAGLGTYVMSPALLRVAEDRWTQAWKYFKEHGNLDRFEYKAYWKTPGSEYDVSKASKFWKRRGLK